MTAIVNRQDAVVKAVLDALTKARKPTDDRTKTMLDLLFTGETLDIVLQDIVARLAAQGFTFQYDTAFLKKALKATINALINLIYGKTTP